MKHRAVRIALFLLVVVAFAGAGYELAMLDRQAAAMRDAARAFEEKARQADAAVHELRAAQFAYLAAGQGPAFWTARGTALLSAIGADLQTLNSLEKTAIAAGLNPLGATSAAAVDDLATVQRIDASVQSYVREEQRLLASDLVFSDLREADQVLGTRIDEARRQMVAAGIAAAERVRKTEIATAGGAALFAVLVLLLLAPSGRGAHARDSAPSPTRPGTRDLAVERGVPGPTRAAQPVQETASAEANVPTRPWPGTPSAVVIHEPVDLTKAAALCTDFARLREASEVPALLERVAGLLDASGIIIWVDDATSRALRPAFSFGYSPQALAQIRAIPRDDDNATAQAYRERTLRVVEEDALSNGAIAAPLLGPDLCVGVMAAEIRRGGEAHADVQAAATILAAQIATLVAPAATAGGTDS
jgi:hypothetical protein